LCAAASPFAQLSQGVFSGHILTIAQHGPKDQKNVSEIDFEPAQAVLDFQRYAEQRAEWEWTWEWTWEWRPHFAAQKS
jgi:hypothetical protein